ncbi:General secretion pathway L [Leptothrix cholodnii SP-6]|uniref:General secretion pathway L n=1 Tax=Leptothrix cholodnii (strain ATCC 51168 / LMG 8142 / SP-6) TaxID=395495 RepID=B1Y326_LEPCP|nr:type II secretion system protein GspL [Leptothrix cholodnii]ACB35682.1 General secretion pathway L [Leptothrix cholodnii SP-6]
MSLLIVQLPPRNRLGANAAGSTAPAPAELAYVLSADGQSVDGEGRCAAALLPRATSLSVVMAGADVSFHRLLYPKAPASRLRAALRGVLEERLLDDPDLVHVALAPDAHAGTECWVAVTDRAWLAIQIELIERTGRAVDRVICAASPAAEGSVGELDVQTLASGVGEAGNELAGVTFSSAEGVACWPWDTQTRPGGLATALLPSPLPAELRCSASPAFVLATEAWLGRPVAVRSQAQRLLAAAHGGWNLRQFDLAPRHRGATLLRDAWTQLRTPAWRPARWGLVGLLAAQLIGLNAWAWMQRSELQERRTAMTNLMRSTHPQVRAILDAPLQMQRENEALRAAAGRAGDTDLEPMLQAAASAWPDNLAVQTLRYENAQLSLGATQLGAEQIERLRSSLQPAGWRVEGGAGLLTLRRGSAPAANPGGQP